MYARLGEVETYFSTFALMNSVDYIIVGCGLAGISFCEVLKANSKTFVCLTSSMILLDQVPA
jgi:hypothetical protein